MDSISLLNGNWPNVQTAITSLSVLDNALYEIFKRSCQTTARANSLIRAVSIARAIYDKKYYKVAFDVTAYSLLYFSCGRLVCIGVDLASEIVNIYQSSQNHKPLSVLKRLDPTTRENALTILGVSPEQAENQEYIEGNYRTLIDMLEKKKSIPSSSRITAEFQNMIDDAESAFKTLSSSFNSSN